MKPKDIFLELLKKDGRPERALKQYEALNVVLYDPVNAYLHGNRVRGKMTKDRWGTLIDFPEDAPGTIPFVTDETKVIKDITHWRDYAVAPDLDECINGDWEKCRQKAAAMDPDGNRLLTAFMGTGIFEQCHFLIPFTDSLTYLYEYPDEMHQLIDYILQYRLKQAEILIDNLHPDAILSHDDWGTKDALFFKPEMWRKFFKEPYRQFYGYIRSRGVITIHHADSYLVPILDDMAEIGIQVWQGALPENNIPEQLRRLNGKMVLMGGIGAAIDREDSTEEEIHKYVSSVLEECCPLGHFIPCITYGLAGAVFHHVDPVIDRTIDEYNRKLHLPHYLQEASVKRQKPNDAASGGQSEAGAATGNTGSSIKSGEDFSGKPEELLSAISMALQDGKKSRVTDLTRKALENELPADTILSRGLISGMTLVGEDFTAGKVFVPEMLMAAQCMNAATDILKPLLTAGPSDNSLGTAVIGTVKGDLHDIGKNLVKIMLEGQGIHVVDLGTDVSAEEFVESARENNAQLICCSAMLTTTMDEMRKVVDLVRKSPEMDHVKVMIGGAPTTQEYCDEIGADRYTVDAASAARAAAAMLQ